MSCAGIDAGSRSIKVVLFDTDRSAILASRIADQGADQQRLGVDLGTLGELSRDRRTPALISNLCVVFAETEIIGLLAEGVAAPAIAAGVQNAIASRVAVTAGRLVLPPALQERLSKELSHCPSGTTVRYKVLTSDRSIAPHRTKSGLPRVCSTEPQNHRQHGPSYSTTLPHGPI